MPAGTYLLAGPDGPSALERFTCGSHRDGWRWQSERYDPAGSVRLGRLDLRLDGSGRTTRLEVTAGPWLLRGGTVGAEALWRRGEQEHEVVADGFTGSSPAYALATLHRLRLPEGGTRRLRLVAVTEPVLAARTVDQTWRRIGPQDYEAVDLATGERRQLHWDGELVEGAGLTLTRL